MLTKTKIYTHLAALGLLFSIASGIPAAAQPHGLAREPGKFQPIEQPLPLKIAVTLGGLALIGTELWWFLFSKPPAKPTEVDEDGADANR